MKTVKVRIAVAVDAYGRWNASGWSVNDQRGSIKAGSSQMMPVSDDESSDVAFEGLQGEGELEALCWVEAEIPIPEATTVQGTVTKE